jgi:hypothetical protein
LKYAAERATSLNGRGPAHAPTLAKPTLAKRTTRASTRSRSRQTTTAEELPYGFLPNPPAIERRKSRINGWGVFALQTIRKNTRIIHYAGEKIPSPQSGPREERYLERGHIWCFKLNNRWVIDAAVGGNVARFINHACKPNCYTYIKDGVIWIRAARTIRKGEELTYNYYTEGNAGIPCRCRPNCQGML